MRISVGSPILTINHGSTINLLKNRQLTENKGNK
jgi:hypothetical protein